MSTKSEMRSADEAFIEECRVRAIALLRRNRVPEGMLAATPGARADARSYNAVFGRDAAICAIGMALSGDDELERRAADSLHTLAAHQAENGQIPKFVGMGAAPEADFWYLGCIDAGLWWLIALALLDGLQGSALREQYAEKIARALNWLQCQEHPRFRLLQQNEASDWADIMPRSGFVLYTNALWYWCKRLYRLPHAEATQRNARLLFYPFDNDGGDYRRARLLGDYARDQARHRELYLSFVNFSFFGDEGDVFGNVLAVLCGLGDEHDARRVLNALEAAGVHEPYPVRAVVEPIAPGSFLWRPYMARHEQNYEWQYHNGGIWPFIGGFWICAQAAAGRKTQARQELLKLARVLALDDWSFNEWLQARTLERKGMAGQSWNAAAFVMAHRVVMEESAGFAII